MRLLSADMVLVFRKIGQVAEIREGTNHADGLVAAECGQEFFQGGPGLGVRIAPKGHRQTANLFNQCKRFVAFLLANDVA